MNSCSTWLSDRGASNHRSPDDAPQDPPQHTRSPSLICMTRLPTGRFGSRSPCIHAQQKRNTQHEKPNAQMESRGRLRRPGMLARPDVNRHPTVNRCPGDFDRIAAGLRRGGGRAAGRRPAVIRLRVGPGVPVPGEPGRSDPLGAPGAGHRQWHSPALWLRPRVLLRRGIRRGLV